MDSKSQYANDNTNDNDNDNDKDTKIDIKNIALKAPKKSRGTEGSFWRMFWLTNIPKREGVMDIRKEYSQVMENMTPT